MRFREEGVAHPYLTTERMMPILDRVFAALVQLADFTPSGEVSADDEEKAALARATLVAASRASSPRLTLLHGSRPTRSS
jgi:hypothetical protein